MAISAPSLTVEVYNADYRVLSRIPWQEAVLLILRGAVDELRQSLEKTSVIGTHSFDQSLLDLYQRGHITQEVALANADSRTDLGLRMRLHSSHDPH